MWVIIVLMITFGAGYGTREMISRRRYRRHERSKLEAYYNAQETNAPKPAPVSTAFWRWTQKAIEVVDYIVILILLAAIGFVILGHLMWGL